MNTWVDYFLAIGGLGTAGALVFYHHGSWRAWIGGATDPLRGKKVRYENDRFVLHCKNYGKFVARISWTKSAIRQYKFTKSDIGQSPLTKSDINKNLKNHTKKIIFPDHDDEFTTNEYLGIYESTEDVEIWFGFIIGSEGNSEQPGEYCILGKYVREKRIESITHIDEWFEPKPRRLKAPWYKSKSSPIDNSD
jgi:hypothetical protein